MRDNHHHAHRAGPAALERPTSGEPLAVAAAQGFRNLGQGASSDFQAAGSAEQAALTIEGEAYALAYIEQLDRGTAQAAELATLLSFLRGEMLHGACRLIEKALEGCSHA